MATSRFTALPAGKKELRGSALWLMLTALTLCTWSSANAWDGEYRRPQNIQAERVAYQHPYGIGEFVQLGPNRWSERNPDGNFFFEERYRYQGVVQLYDVTRDTWIILDLSRRQIQVSQHGAPFGYLYPILGDARETRSRGNRHDNGYNGARVYRTTTRAYGEHFDRVYYSHGRGQGEFLRVGPQQWIERNPDGQFRFEERRRHDGQVELYDRARDVWILIDSGQRSIRISQSGAPYRYLYTTLSYY